MNPSQFISIISLGFYVFISSFAFGQIKVQEIEYTIHAVGLNVGKLHVKEQTQNDNIVIEATTEFLVKFIITYKVKFYHKCSYRNNSLFNSQIYAIKNGKLDSNTKILKERDYYLLIVDGDSSKIFDEIKYSGGLTYFHEPKQIPFIYFEKNGEKKAIKFISKDKYQVLNNKNDMEREFVYKNGILSSAKVKLAMATIYLKRVN